MSERSIRRKVATDSGLEGFSFGGQVGYVTRFSLLTHGIWKPVLPGMTPEELMQLAIAKTREGLAVGQSPFGCAIARGDELLSCTHNSVVQTTDITAHAEVNALRAACRYTGEILLEGAIVATTCEPCPMCMAALHWARVDTVYCGASIADAAKAGFNELQMPAEKLLAIGGSKVKLIPGVLTNECRQLFDLWLADENRRVY